MTPVLGDTSAECPGTKVSLQTQHWAAFFTFIPDLQEGWDANSCGRLEFVLKLFPKS